MSGRAFADAILIDEVGIETGVHGASRLQTWHRPIVSPIGDCLRITAVSAETAIVSEDRPRDPDVNDQAFPAGLRETVHLNNHRNLSIAPCDLFLDHEATAFAFLQGALVDASERAAALGESGLRAEQVVCRITDATSLPDDELDRVSRQLRDAGFRIAIDLFDNAFALRDSALPLRPDIAEINGGWLAKIARENAAARLLRPLIAAYKQEAVRIFIGGISTAEQLKLAIEAGADYLAGDHLARALPVGMIIDDEPKPIAALLQAPPRVSQLFG